MKLEFDHAAASFVLELLPDGKDYTASIGDRTISVRVLKTENGRLDLLLDGERVTAYVSSDGPKRWVTVHGQTFILTRSSGGKRGRVGHHHEPGLTAPMPGQIRAVSVTEGESVKKGQTLLVLEAMKMEIRVQAPWEGVVTKLLVRQGDTVEREQLLIEVSEA